ncbi:MAG: sigma-70 family RNA polymerase sigma factor [Planctomycetaceae bacterium]
MTRYRHPALRQLTEQLTRFSPIDVRVQQVDRAENLVTELDEATEYTYPDLVERITGYRSDKYPDLKIDGATVVHDIRLLVEDLSASANLPVDQAGEQVLTVEDLSKKYNVSTKTVDRWRKRGLISRRFKFGNRTRVGFLNSSVERFVTEHGDEIQRGTRFSQLSDEEREDIVLRARKYARTGACPSAVSERLARHFGRSPETIRYTLKKYDADHPENAIFPNAHEQLSDDQRTEIYNRFRRGTAVDILAGEYCRTKASIYRIVTEERARLLFDQPIDYMDNPAFRSPNADREILCQAPENDQKAGKVKPPPGLPPYLASLYSIPLLNREQEAHYFRKFNYLKFRAHKLRERIDRQHPKATDLELLEQLLEQAQQVKNFLIRSNLRLVVSIAKRHMTASSNFFEMVSDGNMSLFRAVEKFDFALGNKFSTYATWAIMKNFARSIPAEYTRQDRFRTGNDEMFDYSTDDRRNPYEDQRTNEQQHNVIMSILQQLEDRERSIIIERFGLDDGTEPLTLEQVGERHGVTKERIRQIETRALQKIRKIASEEHLEIPGV